MVRDSASGSIVVIVHDNGLIGSGLAMVLEEQLGVPCRLVRSADPATVHESLDGTTRVVVLECPDALANAAARAAIAPVPVIDITGSVGGHGGTGGGESREDFMTALRGYLSA